MSSKGKMFLLSYQLVLEKEDSSTQIEVDSQGSSLMSFLMEYIGALCCSTVLLDASGESFQGLGI